mmetsp:Transcript_57133/g.183610  ORF Transcript_57133/g.183610 Transcript_57133/m.183610 type:complete len:88 (+) Transcript_57133:21-284(+)
MDALAAGVEAEATAVEEGGAEDEGGGPDGADEGHGEGQAVEAAAAKASASDHSCSKDWVASILSDSWSLMESARSCRPARRSFTALS